MRKVFSHFNPAPMQFEYNSGISLTEPDQSLSLNEIIQSFMDGVVIDADPDSIYDGDDDLEPESVQNYDDIFDAIDSAPEKESEKEPEKESEKEPEKEPESEQSEEKA